MRGFITVNVSNCENILRDGWWDMHNLFGVAGVHISDRPLDAREGFEGLVTLCLEIPEEVFEKHEWIEDVAEGQEHVPGDPMPAPQCEVVESSDEGIVLHEKVSPGQKFSAFGSQPGTFRYAIIPAAELNQIGKPEIYDHYYAGSSRKQLVDSIRSWEEYGSEGALRHAQKMRDAVEFFDRHGWTTLVRLKEQPEESD
jgi:hypothetical protein